ncbi:MAG: AI-2E family transporter [Eubacteriales bacterium]|nr:AI-2E family transporter [Eubacteriales bacterium]
MDKKSKENLLIVIIGICLFAALMHLTTIIGFAKKIIGLILPIVVGGILALFINVPMSRIEKRLRKLFSKSKKQSSGKAYRIASFILTLICIVLVLSLVFTLLIPEMIRSVQSLTSMLETRIPEWTQYLDAHNINAEWLEKFLADINLDQMLNTVSDHVDMVLASIVDTVSSAVSIVTNAAFGFIIGIYMVLDKERIHRHSNKFLRSYLKPSWADKISQIFRMFNTSFANFLSGQCGEAMILGTLMSFAFVIFRLPYASLVGVLTAVCAIIPYVGAFISCVVSVFLTLIIDPTLAIRCMVVYLVVQFGENQFIYPRVVGGSVGLPPLYTLVAAMIGGKLFGILGILFFIPLASVIVDLLKDGAKKRGLCKNTEINAE